MTDPLDVIRALPANVVEETYSDAVKGTLREASKLGVDAVKTIRLMLFPLQFVSAFQDRLAAYILRAVCKIPPDRRITPTESLALQLTEKLRLQEDGSIITEMYVNLLTRAMDRERVGEAHPAFIQIVSQLAPDEALLIEQLAAAEVSSYMRFPGSEAPILREQRATIVGRAPMNINNRSMLIKIMVRPEELAEPGLSTLISST